MHCTDRECSETTQIAVEFNSAEWFSMTTGVDGQALISYSVDGQLRVAHCSNRFCLPWHRPR